VKKIILVPESLYCRHTEKHIVFPPEFACTSTCNLSPSSTQNLITSTCHVVQSCTSHSYKQEKKDNPDDKKKLLQQTGIFKT